MKKVVLYTILLLLLCSPLFAKADVRVIDIVSPPNPPEFHVFGVLLEPVVTIKNVGSETISSIRIAYFVAIKNNSSVRTTGPSTTWTGILPPGQSINVQLEAFKTLGEGRHGIEVFINQINDKRIGVKNNRKISRVFKVKKRSEDIFGSSITKLNRKQYTLRSSIVANVHPDHQAIISDLKFRELINNLPEKERKNCIAIVDQGSAAEVIALLNDYKQNILGGNSSSKIESKYVENTDQAISDNLNTHAVGEVVKLNNPSDDIVALYKDSSLKDISILFTNGIRAKIVDVKDSNIYKVKVGENTGWVSGSVIK